MESSKICISNITYEPQKTLSSKVEVEASEIQPQEPENFAALNAGVLKAYAGINESEKIVSKEELIAYLEEIGVKNTERYDEIISNLSDKDRNISSRTLEFLKAFHAKNHLIWNSLKLFEASKIDGKINYKALKMADSIMHKKPKFGSYSGQDYCLEALRGSKNKDGSFNDGALNLFIKHSESLTPYFERSSRTIFAALKNNDGEFSQSSIDFLDKGLTEGIKTSDVLSVLFSAKDENGNFSYEIKKLNDYLDENFDKYQAALVKKAVFSLPANEKNKRAEFIELAKSLKDDKDFLDVWNFISDIKSDENDKSNLDYDRASYDFVKSFAGSSYRGTKELDVILKKLAVPYDSLSKKDVEVLNRMRILVKPEDFETYIDAATWKAGDKKGQFSAENLEKYLDIYSENRMIMNKDDITYLAGCFSLEEDDRALSLFTKLHNLRWTKKIGNFEADEMLDKHTLNFILSLLCLERDGKASRPCYSKALENIEKLFSMELPMSSKDAFENFMSLPEMDIIEKLEKVNLAELGLNTGQISKGVFKQASEEELLTFKDYMKDYLKDKDPKTVDINLNSNISTIVELTTGPDYDKTKLLYDFKKGKPVTELKESNWNSRISRTQKDFLRNTVSEQKFVVLEEGPYGIYKYNVLKSQEFKKYDEEGRLIFTENMEKSPVEGIFNVTKTYADGKVENLCRAQKSKEGNDIIEKHMTSFDGTKTDYRYEDDPAGNRIVDYKITDKNGRSLLNQSVTFEVIDENHFVSSRNNKKFDIQVKGDELVVKNLQNNNTAVINLENFTKSSQEKIIPLLKQLPGEELFAMKELNLESFAMDEKTKNAAFSPSLNAIMFSDKYLDLGVALHEWGHGKDELMFREIGEKICKDKELNKIYNEEKKAFRENFSDAQLEHVGYFAADYHYLGNDAIKEGIAETNTLLSVSPKNATQSVRSQYWQQYFPRTIAYLANLLN